MPSRSALTATLQVVPYYNKPTQEGLYRHFRTIAETVDLPMIAVQRARAARWPISQTTRRCGWPQVPGIVGIKDATGDMARAADLLKRLPQDFAVYSGNDDTALALMLLGGHGVISVTANVAPERRTRCAGLRSTGDFARARELNNQLLPLHQKLFVEPNPIAGEVGAGEDGPHPGGHTATADAAVDVGGAGRAGRDEGCGAALGRRSLDESM